MLGEAGYSGTSLLISTVRKLPCSSNLLSKCYQPEQLKTSHICEISHYILRPVFIHSSWQFHSNIVKMPVERKHKFRRNFVQTFITFPLLRLNRIRKKIRAKAYTNSSQNSSDATKRTILIY